MTTTDQIWIGQNGKQFGPYGETQIRQWLKEGKLAPDAVAWRDGMADWVPIAHLFPAVAIDQPPPPPALPASPPFANNRANAMPESFSAHRDDYSSAADNAGIPTPPSLHWALVWLFAILTCGIFGLVWPFIQASWVRKIDPRSNAMLLLGLATACLVVGYPMYFASLASLARGGGSTVGLAGLLLLASWVLYLIAFFSMAGSLRDKLASRELPLEIGSVSLFFFTMYYLQGQLSWIARWKRTGQVTPHAPKGVFWALFCIVPFVIAVLAAITIPAYQGYITRAEVSQGAALASGAKVAVAEYYNNHGELPANNAAAGLAEGASISGKYVSGVYISDGRVLVAYRTMAANRTIRDKMFVLTPQVNQGSITWSCGDSTIPYRSLPRSCRQ